MRKVICIFGAVGLYQKSIQTLKWAHGRLSYFKDLEAENLRLKLELSSLMMDFELSISLHP